MIRGTIIGGEAAIQRFERMPEKLRIELKAGITRAALRVQTQTKQSKLSGQVLNVRTGRLRRSINVDVQQTAERVVGTVGTNVEYAHIHEYGFTGAVGVREHLRTAKSGKTSIVRGHSRNVHIPEKSFLRSALADMAEPIRHEFEQAVLRATRG